MIAELAESSASETSPKQPNHTQIKVQGLLEIDNK